MDNIIELIFTVIGICAAYVIGTKIERNHYRDIERREKALMALPVVNAKTFLDDLPVAESRLVMGNMVIAGDLFKATLAGILSLFGLRISVAESMIDRARREAVLRLKEQVPQADVILNLRLDTMKIGERQQMGGVEAMAYATAIFYKK